MGSLHDFLRRRLVPRVRMQAVVVAARILVEIMIVLTCSLGTGLLVAWTAIPFLTVEAGYLFFLIGGIIGFVGSLVYVVRRRRSRPT